MAGLRMVDPRLNGLVTSDKLFLARYQVRVLGSV